MQSIKVVTVFFKDGDTKGEYDVVSASMQIDGTDSIKPLRINVFV